MSRPNIDIIRRPDTRRLDYNQKVNVTEQATAPSRVPSAPLNNSMSYSSFKTAEDRAAFIKQQAEQRMAERLAALGLKPPAKAAESDRHKQERDERLRQAEEEDAKRDEDRQRRLAEEKPAPPTIMKSPGKKPPPPPSRGTRAGSLGQSNEARRRADKEAIQSKPEHKKREGTIKDQQEAQERRTKELEYVHFALWSGERLIRLLEMKLNVRKMSLQTSELPQKLD